MTVLLNFKAVFAAIRGTTRLASGFSTWKLNLKDMKWSSGEPMKDGIAKKQAAKVIKKHNWESYNLFGPLLKESSSKRRGVRQKRVPERDAQESESSDDQSTVAFRISEHGFNDVDNVTPLRGINVVTQVDRKQLSPDLDELILPSHDSRANKRKAEDRHNTASNVIVPGFSDSDDDLKTSDCDLFSYIREFPLTNSIHNVSPLAQSTTSLEARGVLVGFPSVTSILQKTLPPESVLALEKWKRRMVDQLGIEGFQLYQEELFRVGKALHLRIQRYLSGRPLSEIETCDGASNHWKSLQPVLGHISDVSLLEAKVRHPLLHYSGILDCVLKYRGVDVLIDWKTSQRPKTSISQTYDNPLQAAAYMGALNFSGLLDFQVTSAAIVVSYACGSPADVYYLNNERSRHYWELWLQRVCKYITLVEQ